MLYFDVEKEPKNNTDTFKDAVENNTNRFKDTVKNNTDTFKDAVEVFNLCYKICIKTVSIYLLNLIDKRYGYRFILK